ncbi:MAG: NYN domain-containing protein, partial [Coleofasciculus sp. S288]|nr:NYN domain-containing protein [Coleofasciculus sp. S288]
MQEQLQSERQANKRKPQVSIYWDCQNIAVSPCLARYLSAFANLQGCLVSRKAYANWRRVNLVSEQRLHELDWDCIDVPLNIKNSVDNKLIADCRREVSSPLSSDIFILVTGDKDFIELVQFLQDKGKKVIIFARTNNMSKRLTQVANAFYVVDEKLPDLVVNEVQPQTINYSDAIKCLIAAIKKALKLGKPTRFELINNLMRSSQGCSNYQGVSSICKPDGTTFRKFSKFIEAVVA